MPWRIRNVTSRNSTNTIKIETVKNSKLDPANNNPPTIATLLNNKTIITTRKKIANGGQAARKTKRITTVSDLNWIYRDCSGKKCILKFRQGILASNFVFIRQVASYFDKINAGHSTSKNILNHFCFQRTSQSNALMFWNMHRKSVSQWSQSRSAHKELLPTKTASQRPTRFNSSVWSALPAKLVVSNAKSDKENWLMPQDNNPRSTTP